MFSFSLSRYAKRRGVKLVNMTCSSVYKRQKYLPLQQDFVSTAKIYDERFDKNLHIQVSYSMADAETFGRETDGADTPCLRPAPFFKPLLTPLPIESE